MVRWATFAAIVVVAVLITSVAVVRAASAAGPGLEGNVAAASASSSATTPDVRGTVGGLALPTALASAIHPDVSAYTTIQPDGSIVGATAPITTTGDTYDLTASFSGAIIDERNDSTFDGNGYTITSSVALGFAFQVNTTVGVTVEDLEIVDEDHAVEVVNSTSTIVSGVNAGTTNGGAFTALESDDVTFRYDGANASSIGFAANFSLAVSCLDDWASNDVVGFTGVFDTGVEELDAVANDDGYGVAVGYDQSVTLLGGSFLSSTEDAVEAIEDSDVSLLGVTLNDSGDGLLAQFSSVLTVAGSDFTDAHSYGALLEYVDDVTIGTSDFDGATLDGLLLNHGAPATLYDDTANDSGSSGFDVENVTTGTLTGLTADQDVWNGLWLADDDGLSVEHGAFDNVSASTGNGSYLRSSTDITLSSDRFLDDAYAVYDVGSHDLDITDSNASLGGVGFLLVEDVDSEVVSDTAFNNSGTSLVFDLSSDFLAESNNLSDDYAGILMVDTLTGDIVGNMVYDAAEFGIIAEVDSGSVISGNFVWNSPFAYEVQIAQGTSLFFDNASNATTVGFYLNTDTGVEIYGGNASNSAIGFALVEVEGGNVTGNTFYHDTDDFDIEVSSLANTVVYWNNFIDGGGWVFDAAGGTATAIDFADGYPGGGNYWSNWTTPDVEHGPDQDLPGGDGIVDVPLPIGGGYVDPYPLTHALNIANLTVVFTARGLPLGTTWGVAWGSSLSESTNGTALSVFTGSPAWANFSYAIDAPAGWNANPAAGTIQYEGALEVVTVDFSPVTYPTTFQETGLPSGTAWSVNVSGTTYSGTSGAITVSLPNGTYNFSVAAVAGYVASPSTGSVTVDANSPTVTVTFAAVLYPVEFSETGLPAGTSWTVTFGGHTTTSIATTLTFRMANGTYRYLVGNVSGYSVSPYSGQQEVVGPGTSISVVYSSTSSASAPLLTWVLLALVVVLAVAVVVLLLRGRRKPEPAPAVASWNPPPAASAPASPPPTGSPPPGAVSPPAPPDWKET